MAKKSKSTLDKDGVLQPNIQEIINNRTRTLTSTTRRDLAFAIYHKLRHPDHQLSKRFVELFFETVRDELLNGGEVKLSSFGSFSTMHKNERPGRNLHTGEPVMISARKVVRFRPSRKLRVAGYQEDFVKKFAKEEEDEFEYYEE